MTTVAIVGGGRHLSQWLVRLDPDPAYRIVAVTGPSDRHEPAVPAHLAELVTLHHRAALRLAPDVLLVLEAMSTPEVIRDGLRAGAHVIADLPIAHRASQVPGFLDLARKNGRRVVVPARRADPGLEVLRAAVACDTPERRLPWAVQADLLYTLADAPSPYDLDTAAALLVRAADLAGVQITAVLADNLSPHAPHAGRSLYRVPVLSTVADGVAVTVRAGAVPAGTRGLTGPAGRWTVTAATGVAYRWQGGEVAAVDGTGALRHRPAPVADDRDPRWLDAVLDDLHGTGTGVHLLGAVHDRHARVVDALLRRHTTGRSSAVPASKLPHGDR
ncbi:hypothetical protein Lfu02_15500 [Longispora fulva]|uniref:Gfo/Idh/MocA-like oxidoreductase N-terminal domain-containing protein n=1 Tax=Longispora fulva TaxID=619741 RepID=A0A8J7GME3_9ACTN|nr:Gfo/Idh/MocA family oxidoreductase [Longispora fulva]MBG6140440.1 hypothetical protein [Longispora fulva]GIG57178.1 hypothetical protein Lfu02_15500 [Longispora fulva]